MLENVPFILGWAIFATLIMLIFLFKYCALNSKALSYKKSAEARNERYLLLENRRDLSDEILQVLTDLGLMGDTNYEKGQIAVTRRVFSSDIHRISVLHLIANRAILDVEVGLTADKPVRFSVWDGKKIEVAKGSDPRQFIPVMISLIKSYAAFPAEAQKV